MKSSKNRRVACGALALALLLVALAVACDSDSAERAADASNANDAAPRIICGDSTCDADQYCAIVCTCCGIPTDAGMQSARSECRPIPAACTAMDICTCEALNGVGACTPANRTIEIPCA